MATKEKQVLFSPVDAVKFFPWIKSPNTLRYWIKKGWIPVREMRQVTDAPSSKRYFLHIDDIQAFLKKTKVKVK
jgi:hypothetical protein